MDLRIILLGMEGSGKSSSGNTILCSQQFHVKSKSDGVTHSCTTGTGSLFEHKVLVVETPGWCQTDTTETELVEEMTKCIEISNPGPNVFLFTVPIGRFTQEQIKMVHKIEEIFGTEVTKYMIVLFTRGDDLDDTSIECYLKNAQSELKSLIAQCGRRYHVFNNREKDNQEQVYNLLQIIKDMVEQNNGQCYTKQMYDSMQEQRRKRQTQSQMVRKTVTNQSTVSNALDLSVQEHKKEQEEPALLSKKVMITADEQINPTVTQKCAREPTVKDLQETLEETELNWREKYAKLERERDELQYQLKVAEQKYQVLKQEKDLEKERFMADQNLKHESMEYSQMMENLVRKHQEEQLNYKPAKTVPVHHVKAKGKAHGKHSE